MLCISPTSFAVNRIVTGVSICPQNQTLMIRTVSHIFQNRNEDYYVAQSNLWGSKLALEPLVTSGMCICQFRGSVS